MWVILLYSLYYTAYYLYTFIDIKFFVYYFVAFFYFYTCYILASSINPEVLRKQSCYLQ